MEDLFCYLKETLKIFVTIQGTACHHVVSEENGLADDESNHGMLGKGETDEQS